MIVGYPVHTMTYSSFPSSAWEREEKNKMPAPEKTLIPQETIESKILLIRRKKVMLDRDLADLYGVTTGNLNKAVRRNMNRFPDGFMFQLTKEKYDSLRFQFGILKRGQHAIQVVLYMGEHLKIDHCILLMHMQKKMI